METKGQSPVAIDPDRPMPFQVSTQLVQAPIGSIHVFRFNSIVQRGKQHLQLGRMMRLDAFLASGLENASSPLCRNDLIMVHYAIGHKHFLYSRIENFD
jgi:hypothetical protein